MAGIPNQKTLLKDKGYKFARETAKFFLEKSGSFQTAAYNEMEMCYRAYYGELINADYKYILNPLNTEDERYVKFPARIRNYNIISPIINAKLGESSKRPFSPTVIVVNSDAENEIQRQIHEAVKEQIAQKLVGSVAAMPEDDPLAAPFQGLPAKEQPPMEQVVTDIKTNYRDERAIVGQESLNIIVYENKLRDFFQSIKLDWHIVGRVITFKEVRDDKVYIYKVSPMDYWTYGGGSDTYDGSLKFLEDKDAHIWRRKMSFHQLLTGFGRELMERIEHDDDENNSVAFDDKKTKLEYIIDKLNVESFNPDSGGVARLETNEYFNDTNQTAYLTSLLNNVEDFELNVYYIEWKTMVKRGKLIYLDEGGVIQEEDVAEDYILDPDNGDLDIEWYWASKFWYAIQETDSNGIIISHGAVEPTRADSINPSDCKSRFNGIFKGNFKDKVYSDIMSGLPYQTLYNIYHYNRELVINKNKEKLTLLPKGLFAMPEYGKDPITAAMYYGMATSIMFFDETKSNAQAILSAIKSIDMSLGNYVEGINSILASVRDEWWDVVGFNRQRFGETYASDGKAVTEQALIRSSIISAEDERKFDMIIESECLGLLELSKHAWKQNKRGMYIASDGREVIYNIDGKIHNENMYGIYIKNSIEEFEKMEKMHRVIELGAQKGNVSPWAIAEALDAKNFAKLKQIAEKHEKIQKEYEMNLQKQKDSSVERVSQQQAEIAQAEREVKILIADKQIAGDIEVATINAQVEYAKIASQEDIAMNDNNDLAGIHESTMNDMIKNRLAERKANLEEYLGKAKVSNDVRNTDIKERKLAIDKMKASRPTSKA